MHDDLAASPLFDNRSLEVVRNILDGHASSISPISGDEKKLIGLAPHLIKVNEAIEMGLPQQLILWKNYVPVLSGALFLAGAEKRGILSDALELMFHVESNQVSADLPQLIAMLKNVVNGGFGGWAAFIFGDVESERYTAPAPPKEPFGFNERAMRGLE